MISELEKNGYIKDNNLTQKGIKLLNQMLDNITDEIVKHENIELKVSKKQFKSRTKEIFLEVFGSSLSVFLYLYPHRKDFAALVNFNLNKSTNGNLQ